MFVEGPTDQMFFENAIKKEMEETYSKIRFIMYARRPKEEIKRLIQTLKNGKTPYVVVTYINSALCSTDKKTSIITRTGADSDKIIVVKTEIESWCAAGLNQSDAESLNVVFRTDTEDVTKEMLYSMMLEGRFQSKIDFLREILKKFSIEEAKRNNRSFQYFCQKFL